MPYPRFQRARNFKTAVQSGADIIFTSTSWTTAASALDMTLVAQAGDVIEYGVNGFWGNDNAIGELDVQFLASSRRFSGASRGYGGWSGQANVYGAPGGSVLATVQAADLTGGAVTLRLVGKVLSGTSKRLYGTDGAYLLFVWAKNLGPPDQT